VALFERLDSTPKPSLMRLVSIDRICPNSAIAALRNRGN
jgi:hypothetical protein